MRCKALARVLSANRGPRRASWARWGGNSPTRCSGRKALVTRVGLPRQVGRPVRGHPLGRFTSRVLISTVGFLGAAASVALHAQTAQQPPATPAAPTRANILRGEYGRIAPTTTCSTTTSTSASIRRRSSSAARTRSASGCSRTTPAFSSTSTRTWRSTRSCSAHDRAQVRARDQRGVRRLSRRRSSRATRIRDRLLLLRHARAERAGSAASRSARTRRAGDWITTACEGEGASIWWPNKDQWRDEVENMDISVAIPNDLIDVSNGRFVGKTDLGDGFTRWDWHIHYPINNYNVSVNIGELRALRRQARRPDARLLRPAGEPREGQDSSSRRPSR